VLAACIELQTVLIYKKKHAGEIEDYCIAWKNPIMLDYQLDRAWENWHRHLDRHAVQYYDRPYNARASYALPSQNMQYSPPRAAYGLGNTYGYADNARVDYNSGSVYGDGSDSNGRGAGSGYHHAHGPGMAARYYGGAGQYYDTSFSGRPYSAAAARHPGRYGLDPSNKNPGNSLFVAEDSDDCDHSDDQDEYGLDPVKGAVADIVKAAKQGVSTVVLAAKLHVDPEHADHHLGLWGKYLDNPNYTHVVQSGYPGAHKEGAKSFILHVLYLHEGRVFTGYVEHDNPGYKKWAKPSAPKKITITLQALDTNERQYGKKLFIKVGVPQASAISKDGLSFNVLFECFPDGMSKQDVDKFMKLSFAKQEKQWIKMHSGRVHEWKTFTNFDKEQAEHKKQVELGLKKPHDELDVT